MIICPECGGFCVPDGRCNFCPACGFSACEGAINNVYSGQGGQHENTIHVSRMRRNVEHEVPLPVRQVLPEETG
ncbi:MAG: hypothetical protein GF364_22590 [Candidatus Lokiarchaeota archaeon]|nr:hypothetical protein [Candidatus Lokiarchaeota archaeon]